MTFHAAFYMKDSPYDVFDLVEKSLSIIEERLGRLDIEIELRPELTGKTSQFGSLEELISLSRSINSCSPCMDFSHLFARTGQFNTEEEFTEVLTLLQNELGRNAIDNMHIHVSGIATNSKGDLKHLNIDDSSFDWKALLRALKNVDAKGYVICNSPNLEVDAKKMKDYYLAL